MPWDPGTRVRPTGTFGHISTFSFYPAHHITMGEGGAVLTNDPLLKKIIASFRDWGRDCWCDPGATIHAKRDLAGSLENFHRDMITSMFIPILVTTSR